MASKPLSGRGTRVPAPLTPSLYHERPASASKSDAHTVPDVHVETILFNLYLSEKARADYWRDRMRKAEKLLAQWKARGFAHKIAARTPITHNPNPSGRKVR